MALLYIFCNLLPVRHPWHRYPLGAKSHHPLLGSPSASAVCGLRSALLSHLPSAAGWDSHASAEVPFSSPQCHPLGKAFHGSENCLDLALPRNVRYSMLVHTDWVSNGRTTGSKSAKKPRYSVDHPLHCPCATTALQGQPPPSPRSWLLDCRPPPQSCSRITPNSSGPKRGLLSSPSFARHRGQPSGGNRPSPISIGRQSTWEPGISRLFPRIACPARPRAPVTALFRLATANLVTEEALAVPYFPRLLWE